MTLQSMMPNRYSDNNTDPFFSLSRALQRSLDDAWRGFTSGMPTDVASMSINMDVREDDNAFYVSADLPGLNQNEVDVSFDNGMLTIRGEKKVEREEKNNTWHIVERSSGSFARRLSLNTNINTNTIDAKFTNGVLNITLPKMTQDQNNVKKITIKTA